MHFTPRPYQIDIGGRVKSYVGDKKILIELKTGMGKSKLAFSIMDDLLGDKRFLFIVPRINLAKQTHSERQGLGYIQGSKTVNPNARVVIATAQTIANRVQKKRINLDSFDYIFFDEVQSLKYKCTKTDMGALEAIEHYASDHTQVIALSATPFKGDGTALDGWGQDDCVTFGKEYDFDYAVSNGYLSDVMIREVADFNTSDLKVSSLTGDFTDSSVKELLKENIDIDIVKSCIPNLVGKTAVFASNIEHCDALNADFLERGYKSEVMHSKMIGNPQDALKRFNDGDIDVLCSAEMLSFGQDVKNLETLVLATPINSISRYLQIIGRGLRPSDGKDYCHILDCMGNVERLGHPFNPVVPKEKGTGKTKKYECEDCGSNRIKLVTESETIEHEHVKRVVKNCPDCNAEEIKIEPLPMFNCLKCNIMSLQKNIYYSKSKIVVDCPHCSHQNLIETITPKEMIISFRDRDEAIRKIVDRAKERFKDDENFRDEFIAKFLVFSNTCRLSDLSHMMDFVLNLRENYSDASIKKVYERMKINISESHNSPRANMIRMFRAVQNEVNYEFIDFLFNNSSTQQIKESTILFEKIRQAVERKAKKEKVSKREIVLEFKQLKSLAVRNLPHLKGR